MQHASPVKDIEICWVKERRNTLFPPLLTPNHRCCIANAVCAVTSFFGAIEVFETADAYLSTLHHYLA